MSGLATNGVPLAVLPLTGNERAAFDTQLTQGSIPETEAVSSSQLATMMGGAVPLVAGRFYGMPAGVTPTTLLTVTATVYSYPFYISNTVAVKTLSFSTTTGQTGGAGHIGIYADNGAGYPGALVTNSESGALAATATAVSTYTPTTPITLNAGWYWLATIFTATGTFPTVTASTVSYGNDLNAQLGSDTAAHFFAASGQAATGISVAGTYGTLPNTFATGATLTLNAATPLVALGL